MNIAIFSESYRPVINGVARSIDTLAESLLARGHTCCIYAPAARGLKEQNPLVRRFPSYYLPGIRDYPLAIPFSPRLFREFGSLAFDVVHIQTPFALGLCGLALARRHGIPVVATMHTLYEEYAHYARGVPPGLVRHVIRRFTRWFYNRVDVVVTPSPSVRALLNQYGVTRPIYVAPTGVEMPSRADQREARALFGIPDDVILLLYVGRLAVEKRIGLLIEAFARVRREVGSARLLVVGDGPYRKEAEELALELGIADAVHFAGFRAHPDVVQACSAADIFAFPSDTDTQAISVVEAMACSVPPVVVRAYGPADIVEDGVSGRVVGAEAPAFAGAVLQLVKDPVERRHLGDGARLRSRDFSTDTAVAAMLEAYEAALHRRRQTAQASDCSTSG